MKFLPSTSICLVISVFISFTALSDGNESAAFEPGDVFKDCDQCPEMVVVPAGQHIIGFDPEVIGEDSLWLPYQRITFDYQFAVGRFELLKPQYQACVNAGVCDGDAGSNHDFYQTIPAYNLSWNQADTYVRWLAKKTGKPYRLLSESEWEYVANAGRETRFWWGDEFRHNMMVCSGCSSAQGQVRTVGSSSNGSKAKIILNRSTYLNPVGGENVVPPNPFGVYFMLGNAQELVADCFYMPENRPAEIPGDGSPLIGDNDCTMRVVKGADYSYLYKNIYPARRNGLFSDRIVPKSTKSAVSMRVALSLD